MEASGDVAAVHDATTRIDRLERILVCSEPPVTPSEDEILGELLKRANDTGRRPDTSGHREAYFEPLAEISGESSSEEDQEQNQTPSEYEILC